VALTQQPVSCRACGAGVFADALFCSRCGARLDEALATPERRVVTALFCDLVGSTELAEATAQKTLAKQYEWHGTLDDAARWVGYCCAAAGRDAPALLPYALPPAGAGRALTSATEA
jgi:hypothetical protein